jgi:hypothetical protein
VKFDPGEGPEAPAQKLLNKSGTYKVAVDTQTNQLDLFSSTKTEGDPSLALDRPT